MLERLKTIGQRMNAKLHLMAHFDKNVNQNLLNDSIIEVTFPSFYDNDEAVLKLFENPNYDPNQYSLDYYFKLLRCACQWSMIEDLNELLTIKKFDVNSRFGVDNESLLGIAAYHGNFQLVKYLVEVKSADVNAAANIQNGTAMHQVVFGDSYPVNRSSCGNNQHEEVANYLIEHKADLSRKDNRFMTAWDWANKASPSLLEELQGRNTDRLYLADKVRPVLEEALKVNRWNVSTKVLVGGALTLLGVGVVALGHNALTSAAGDALPKPKL